MDKRSNTTKFAAILVAGSGLFGTMNAAHAEISMAQREACTPDALRLCSAMIPDVDKVKACMFENKASLSARCRAAFPSTPIRQAASPQAKQRVHVVSASKQAVSVKRLGTHDSYRRVAVRNHDRHRSGASAFGTNDMMNVLNGSRQISPNEAMGMARQILTTYRAACGNRAIPADYCAF